MMAIATTTTQLTTTTLLLPPTTITFATPHLKDEVSTYLSTFHR